MPTALDAPCTGDVAKAYVHAAVVGLYTWPVLILLVVGLFVEPIVRARRQRRS